MMGDESGEYVPDFKGYQQSWRRELKNTPFFPKYEGGASVVSKDLDPPFSWIRGSNVIDKPGHNYYPNDKITEKRVPVSAEKSQMTKTYPNTGPPGWASRASAQTPQYDYTMDASAGSPAKKKGSMIKDIADALKDLKPGPDASELAGGKFGRGMPAQLGFSLASMGGRLGEQEAMAKARREEELRRRMKLMGGGY